MSKIRAANPKELTIILNEIGNYIKSIAETTNVQNENKSGYSIRDLRLGQINVSSEEMRKYKTLQKKIIAIMSEIETISPKTIERLLNRTILRVVNPSPDIANISLDNRIKNSISNLQKELTAPLSSYLVFIPLGGLEEGGLPFGFGKVEFCIFNETQSRQFFDLVNTNEKDVSLKQMRVDILNTWLIDNPKLQGATVAKVKVEALDEDAARQLALKEVRLTIDIINFYSDLVRYQIGFLYLPGDREPTYTSLPVITTGLNIRYGLEDRAVGPIGRLNLRILNEYSDHHDMGLSRISKMLNEKRDSLNRLEQRLIAALQWAGRATIDAREEEAFLLFTIALESIILADSDKEELRHRLRERAAHLISDSPEERKKIFGRLGKLYDLRSMIVHGGVSEVPKDCLQDIRFFAKEAIIRLLTNEEFKNMTKPEELSFWFTNRILS